MPALLLGMAGALSGLAAHAAEGARTDVLRIALARAEVTFDPAQTDDISSGMVISAIFDAPLRYDAFARPERLKPNTLVALPEISSDFRRYTLRVRPGIFFADDPAFGGQPRELTAADYAYALKRHYDPRWRSPHLQTLESAGLLGLGALRQRALATGRAFDYDAEVEGLRVLDRYTLQLRFARPRPRFSFELADASWCVAVAREVVEAYGDRIGEHPVGTGAYRLTRWLRASRIELDANPRYRDEVHDERAPAADAALAATLDRLRGRRLPLVRRVELDVIEEVQPRWLAFLNDDHDFIFLPSEFTAVATPNNVLAPNLRRRGLQMVRVARPDVWLTIFNMDDPVIGGYAPAQVALRRAFGLAIDLARELRLLHQGQAEVAQSLLPPTLWPRPWAHSEMGEYNPARAQALLDLYGYRDRDGDGWRERPDGTPLAIEYAIQPDQRSRRFAEGLQKDLARVGVRVTFSTRTFGENLKRVRAGAAMAWGSARFASSPDVDSLLTLGYGPSVGEANMARLRLPAYDSLYEQQTALPDGSARDAVLDEASRLLVAYMPYKAHVHRMVTVLAQPRVQAFAATPFLPQAWAWMEVGP